MIEVNGHEHEFSLAASKHFLEEKWKQRGFIFSHCKNRFLRGTDEKTGEIIVDPIYYEHADIALPPFKDYAQVIVSKTQVVYRCWKILPPKLTGNVIVHPLEIRESHEDFHYDDRLHCEVDRVFGHDMRRYLRKLVVGKLDFIVHLPIEIKQKIVLMLDLRSTAALACTNKSFREVCSGDWLWQQLYMDRTDTQLSEAIKRVALKKGWKWLFFTSKLELQKHLRREDPTNSAATSDKRNSASGDANVSSVAASAPDESDREKAFFTHSLKLRPISAEDPGSQSRKHPFIPEPRTYTPDITRKTSALRISHGDARPEVGAAPKRPVSAAIVDLEAEVSNYKEDDPSASASPTNNLQDNDESVEKPL